MNTLLIDYLYCTCSAKWWKIQNLHRFSNFILTLVIKNFSDLLILPSTFEHFETQSFSILSFLSHLLKIVYWFNLQRYFSSDVRVNLQYPWSPKKSKNSPTFFSTLLLRSLSNPNASSHSQFLFIPRRMPTWLCTSNFFIVTLGSSYRENVRYNFYLSLCLIAKKESYSEFFLLKDLYKFILLMKVNRNISF